MKGNISIVRLSGQKSSIEIEDNSSGVVVLRIVIEPRELLLALQGVASRDCEFELTSRANLIGKTREFKKEVVSFSEEVNHNTPEHIIEAGLEPYETDGWLGFSQDARNHHNWVAPKKYRISFVRYV